MQLSLLKCCCKQLWLYFMFLKLSPKSSIIVVVCTSFLDIWFQNFNVVEVSCGYMDMFLKLWAWNFNVVELYSGILVLWVLLKCFYFGSRCGVLKSCSSLVLVSMVTICIPCIMSSKGNNLIIRHPFIYCLAHARCLAYCWTQVVHLRFAPMYLCGFVCKLAWKL
jgi:hypothetical protein